MLDFETIIREFPVNEQSFKRNILREYLQSLILDIIYKSQYGRRLVFLGGTALRIVHGNTRFSEDLDFDNVGLNEDDFTIAKKSLFSLIQSRRIMNMSRINI